MIRASVAAFLALAVSSAFATDVPVSVFVTTKDGKAVDLSGWTASIKLEPKGLEAKTVALDLKKVEGGSPSTDHGGQVVVLDDLAVEYVPGWTPGDKAESSYFTVNAPLNAWVCPMQCVDPADKPGQCAKCGMDLEEGGFGYAATITFKTAAGEKVVKGFTNPTPAPASWADGVKEAKTHVGKALKGSAAIPRVRRIRRIAEVLATLAGDDAGKKAKAKAVGKACDAAEEKLLSGDASDELNKLESKISGLPE